MYKSGKLELDSILKIKRGMRTWQHATNDYVELGYNRSVKFLFSRLHMLPTGELRSLKWRLHLPELLRPSHDAGSKYVCWSINICFQYSKPHLKPGHTFHAGTCVINKHQHSKSPLAVTFLLWWLILKLHLPVKPAQFHTCTNKTHTRAILQYDHNWGLILH